MPDDCENEEAAVRINPAQDQRSIETNDQGTTSLPPVEVAIELSVAPLHGRFFVKQPVDAPLGDNAVGFQKKLESVGHELVQKCACETTYLLVASRLRGFSANALSFAFSKDVLFLDSGRPRAFRNLSLVTRKAVSEAIALFAVKNARSIENGDSTLLSVPPYGSVAVQLSTDSLLNAQSQTVDWAKQDELHWTDDDDPLEKSACKSLFQDLAWYPERAPAQHWKAFDDFVRAYRSDPKFDEPERHDIGSAGDAEQPDEPEGGEKRHRRQDAKVPKDGVPKKDRKRSKPRQSKSQKSKVEGAVPVIDTAPMDWPAVKHAIATLPAEHIDEAEAILAKRKADAESDAKLSVVFDMARRLFPDLAKQETITDQDLTDQFAAASLCSPADFTGKAKKQRYVDLVRAYRDADRKVELDGTEVRLGLKTPYKAKDIAFATMLPLGKPKEVQTFWSPPPIKFVGDSR
ncbi:hypothetical protein RISK_005273 [Rhodopirellula islandica]|uniref:Uncharacterized protein n=1 Tax=Rhodopirellula islandica TaxID=595434 RepID=A0A0J1B638_RHOIS|nr:hypothetical protein [Rhodopirellula islandica]KLU02207.1 hypothetical protein RISK_005273 [Rhodopirellula islandica]